MNRKAIVAIDILDGDVIWNRKVRSLIIVDEETVSIWFEDGGRVELANDTEIIVLRDEVK